MPINHHQFVSISKNIESTKYKTFQCFNKYHKRDFDKEFVWGYCGFYSVYIEAINTLLQEDKNVIKYFMGDQNIDDILSVLSVKPDAIDFKKLNINIKNNYSKIISGVNSLRLANNPVNISKDDLKNILIQ